MKREDFYLCVDPGHGMSNRTAGVFDSGAEANGTRECDVALDWAKAIKYVFTEAGLRVYMTRTDNKTACPVSKRAGLATAAGCTHFLSIHCNAADGKASGVETFIRNSGDAAWGAIVQQCAISATGLTNRKVKKDTESQHHGGLAVLNFVPPGALLETGFLDNLKDRSLICRRDVRLLFAERLLEEVEKLFAEAA